MEGAGKVLKSIYRNIPIGMALVEKHPFLCNVYRFIVITDLVIFISFMQEEINGVLDVILFILFGSIFTIIIYPRLKIHLLQMLVFIDDNQNEFTNPLKTPETEYEDVKIRYKTSFYMAFHIYNIVLTMALSIHPWVYITKFINEYDY